MCAGTCHVPFKTLRVYVSPSGLYASGGRGRWSNGLLPTPASFSAANTHAGVIIRVAINAPGTALASPPMLSFIADLFETGSEFVFPILMDSCKPHTEPTSPMTVSVAILDQ